MKAIRIHGYGGSDALVYEDAPTPEVKEDQVLVEIYATSVNHFETMVASGKVKDSVTIDFPWIPGYDFAGRIDFVGNGITGFKTGDQVYGRCNGGSYAEYIAIDNGRFAPMPDNLSFVEAASVPHVGLTAWEAVFQHGHIEPGQVVLIHGAAGAVGSFAVQFAKLAGGFVYAVDRTANHSYLESLGADVVIGYETTDFTTVAKDVDLVLDFVGRDTPTWSYPVMKEGGRLVSTVVQIPENEGRERGVTAMFMSVRTNIEYLKEITQLIESGKVKTDIAKIFPLEKAAEAWNTFLHKDLSAKDITHGKIILEVKGT